MSARSLVVRLLALVLVASGSALGIAMSPAQGAAAPVAVTGTVTDASTAAGIEGALVEADGVAGFDDAVTGAGGGYSLALEPGTYDFYVSAEGYESSTTSVEVTAGTTTLPLVELTPLPDPVTVSGTVLDASTDVGIVGASVQADGPSFEEATTGAGGSYTMSIRPGSYELFADANGYEGGSVLVEVTEATTTLPPIELTAVAPGIYVSVTDGTFGGPAANVQVQLSPSGGGTPTVLTTDSEGEVTFSGVANGQYTITALPGGDYVLDGEPVTVDYTGGFAGVELSVVLDLSCEPASASQGLTNMGFESNLDHWTLGYQTETIQAVAADTFTAPWEGSKMARLGHSRPSSDENQPEGPNVMCQDFVVTDPEESFAFNVFTYDYTGFDEFEFDVVVSSPETGETLAAYRQGAWGEGTALKTSGWRGVKLDLAGHVGDTVRLTFRAGGTRDDLYAFWGYLDSAETLPPVIELPTTSVDTTTGSVTTDPVTGQLTVSMPTGSKSAVTMTVPAACENPSTTPSVSLNLNGEVFPGTPAGSGKFTVTIPEDQIVSGPLSLQVVCEGETTVVTPIGQIVLYDPSGTIKNAVTGQPVVGAEVSLYKVPGWTPQGETGPYPDTSCQTNLSKETGAPWNQAAPTNLGELVNAASPEISPNVNPFVTNNVGYYGWDVAEGCWYVEVNADGYFPLTSPVVGVPTAVTDLNLELQPSVIGNTVLPTITGKRTVGSVLTASTGTWSTPGVTFAYQWLRNGVPIAGATTATHKVVAADVTKALRVRVTASKATYTSGVALSPNAVVPKQASQAVLSVATKFKSSVRALSTVTVKAAAGLPRTGKVVIKAGTKIVGTGNAVAGKAKIRLKRLAPGRYKLVARYAGNAVLLPSKSAVVRVRVVR